VEDIRVTELAAHAAPSGPPGMPDGDRSANGTRARDSETSAGGSGANRARVGENGSNETAADESAGAADIPADGDHVRGAADESPAHEQEPVAPQPIPLNRLHPDCWESVWSVPQLAAEAEELAQHIAGKDAPPHILALARDIAEEQVNRDRARHIRHELDERLAGKKKVFGDPLHSSDLLVVAKSMRRPSAAARTIRALYRCIQVSPRERKAQRAFDVAVRREDANRRRLLDAAYRRMERNQRKAAKRAANTSAQ
jgi:hypothetical protein